jgi:AraC-like DNA-binding protein
MRIALENTQRPQNDCFAISSRKGAKLSDRLHQHNDIEINLILNACGAQRIIGEHIGQIEDVELVCIGPNMAHGWFTHTCKNENIKEVTLHFPGDIFDERCLNFNQLTGIRNLFENSKKGILFSKAIADKMADKILGLVDKTDFDGLIDFFSIINELAISTNSKLLSGPVIIDRTQQYANQRLERVFELMNEGFSKQLSLTDAADIAGMSYASFSRFIKSHTGNSFVHNLNEIRLKHVSQMLICTGETIAEIAYKCGFNNIAHFNRMFKNNKGLTPREYRGKHSLIENISFF